MKYISAIISFLFVFVGVFFIAGFFLMPYLPPVPKRPISVVEVEYWITNWIGILLGILFGLLSAYMVLRRPVKKDAKRAN